MPDRRTFLIATGALAVSLAPPLPARAHHGWSWTDAGEFRLIGVIRSARLGNPHGILEVEADDEIWTAEVGQPWRNERAGLTDAMLAPGTELTLEGERSADPEERRMKAERVVIAGATYVLYPDRS